MMTSAQILNEINEKYSEHLEMMSIEEKFIIMKNVLAQKVAEEMAWKEHYKSCWNQAMKPSVYKGINS